MIVASSATSADADTVYGPPPPPIPVPGGYFQVVTSQTIGTAGGTIGPLSAGNVTAGLVISGRSFTTPLQVTITEPDVAAIGDGGRRNHLAIGGVGVVIQNNGAPFVGFFHEPLILTLSSPQLSPGDIVVVWNGRRFVPVPDATVHHHTVTIRIFSPGSQFFAILSPTGGPVTGIARRSAQRGTPSGVISQLRAPEAVFAALIRRPAGTPMPGLGVLAPAWLNIALSRGAAF
jgi:hypothetical protein